MIKFELNDLPFALTNDQFIMLTSIMAKHGWDRDYDIVEGDTAGLVWLWAHPPHNPWAETQPNPIRYWIEVDGQVTTEEEVTWDWKGIQHDH
jgi:hypothetical protein